MQGNPIRLSADFSIETLQVRREWDDIFKVTCKSMANSCQCMTKTTTIKKKNKVMKREKLQPRICILTRSLDDLRCTSLFFLFFLYFYFWLCRVACGILVS